MLTFLKNCNVKNDNEYLKAESKYSIRKQWAIQGHRLDIPQTQPLIQRLDMAKCRCFEPTVDISVFRHFTRNWKQKRVFNFLYFKSSNDVQGK